MIKKQEEKDGYRITEFENGTVIEELIPEPETPVEPALLKPMLEEQVTQLQQQNMILMDALATIYEELTLSKEV